MKKINFPKSGISNESEIMEIGKSTVIIGANGSGKTRFGIWLEHNNELSKRVNAQRELSFSEYSNKDHLLSAKNGYKDASIRESVKDTRKDFTQLLTYLFASEDSFLKTEVLDRVGIDDNEKLALRKKESPISKTLSIWNTVFVNRPLKLENNRIVAVGNDTVEFDGSEMSDGERTGLYLIVTVILAEKDRILIIDEPCTHLHESIMTRLWNKLEEERSDCKFIYITHDLDFAAKKIGSKKIWLKSYQKDNLWDWEDLKDTQAVPNKIFYEIIGCRQKKILLVEGTSSSLDSLIYEKVYDDFQIIQIGSCRDVIKYVEKLRKKQTLHGKEVYGIIDLDYRSKAEVTVLKKDNVFCIDYKDLENLLLAPSIVKILGEIKKFSEEEVIKRVKKCYSEKVDQIREDALKFRLSEIINDKINTAKDKNDYKNSFMEMAEKLDDLLEINEIPDANDDVKIEDVLRYYGSKDLAKKVFGQKEEEILNDLFVSDKKEDLITVLKACLPIITP